MSESGGGRGWRGGRGGRGRGRGNAQLGGNSRGAWRGGLGGAGTAGYLANSATATPTTHAAAQQSSIGADQTGDDDFRFGYVSSITLEKHGFVSFDDNPSARHGAIFGYHWVEKLNLQVGDRLRYRLERRGKKSSAIDISRAPLDASPSAAISPIADQLGALALSGNQTVAPPPAANQDATPRTEVAPTLASPVVGAITGMHAVKDRDFTLYQVTTATGKLSFRPRKIYYGCWSPKPGDQIICTPREAKPGQKPSMDIWLEQPTQRNDQEVESFIESLSSMDSIKDIQQLLEVPPSWAIVGQWPGLDAKSLYLVIKFFVSASDKASSYQQQNLGLSIRHLMHERNFQLDRGACRELFAEASKRWYPAEKLRKLKTFCEMVGQLVPERCYLIMQLCRPFYSIHFKGEDAFELAMLMCKSFLPLRNSDLSWHELSATLSKEEVLNSASMGESIRLLPSVRTHAPYDSVSDYLETNLKLLRADCFEKLRSGIQQFVGGTLNRRDMAVYHQVELRGIDVTHKELSLVLKIKPFNRVVKDWDKSPLLMFGNLLCLSFDVAFSEFICVTVSNRDSDLLNKSGLIFVEPIFESNSIELSDLLRRLRIQKSALWLAESPTYFQAYRHVLKNVQALHGKKLPLKNELVSCCFDSIEIEYAKVQEEPDPIVLHRFLGHRRPVSSSGKNSLLALRRKFTNQLDKSQKKAFKNCTQRRVSVIQGPPGCGKTYVGTHLLAYLTARETKQQRRGPVLLVTYKNNALDEFIRKILANYRSEVDIIRLGGRSRKTELTKELDIRSRRDTVLDEECRDKWRLVEQAKETLLKHLSTVYKQETVVFNEYFLSKYWSEENQIRFWKQFLQQPVGNRYRNQQLQPAEPQQKLQLAVQVWIPPQPAIDKFMPAMLQPFQTEDASRENENATKSEEEAEDDEINDEQEQMKMERLLASGGDSRSTFSLDLARNFTSYLRLDHRLIRLVSEKWQALRYCQNLWELKHEDRFLFIQGCLLDYFEKVWARQSSKLNFFFRQYLRHRDAYKEANLNRDVQICQDVDVIAMTITGASINNELLKRLRPNTVVVEEAAEIMEPMLLGCLGDWAERLYLIGDHKQLRPNVENFDLVKHCHLDVSMMERLINCGFPFDRLQFQNRMRTDISKYLKLDVYPDLKDNEDSVRSHEIPSFMANAVAFWDVENMPEWGERSYVNEGEAELIVQLALTFLRFGYKPSQITILTPYQGQVRLIRQKLRPKLHQWRLEASPDDCAESVKSGDIEPDISNVFIKVHSIDVYQGDENDIILVSLVRSEKPGFLASLNRRCVAQSRSHCGLVFVGRASLLKKCPEWHPLLTAFEEDGVLRPDLPVVCRRHETEHSWRTAAELARTKGVFCTIQCMEPMPCGKHKCPKPCQPWHEHDKCKALVSVKLPCSHSMKVECFRSKLRHSCQEKCIKLLSCGHPCPFKCSEKCDAKFCTEKIDAHLICGHVQSKLCNQPILPCQVEVAKTLPCGHVKQKPCLEWKMMRHEVVKCTEDCQRTLTCGHICTQKCFETCSPELCKVSVSKRCVTCQEKFNSTCGMNKTQCERLVPVILPCGHQLRALCSQSLTAKLTVCKKPCQKKLSCGHKCQSVCSTTPCPPCPNRVLRQDCMHECQCWELEEDCLTEVTKKFQCDHEATVACCAVARLPEDQSCSACWELEKQKRLRQLQLAHGSALKRTKLTESDENTAVEYFKVHDRVMRYIKDEHSVKVRNILSIEKIENITLDRRLLDVCSQLVKKNSVPELFFHGTRSEIAERIIREGFKVGTGGMYGAGIYFATDTTKSVQYCRESGTMSLLLCDVLLGRTMVCDTPQNHLNLSAVVGAGYDSVFARRNTKGTGGVLNDEYIVYRPEQAAPRYLIRFTN